MKKKILIVFVLVTSLFINSLAPVFAALQSEPPPRLSFNKDLYQTDLFTGSATYSYPIKVPKGTNDLTPDVSLSYNSSATHGSSAYTGMGWDLNTDYIERDVEFTPGSTGDDTYKLRFKGAMHDLVYVASESAYHTKIESNLNITKLTSGEDNDYNEYWQVITPDGTKYRFGQGTNSELVCNGRSYVYRWHLDQVEDRHTNKIFYNYTETGGASYLSEIEYNSDRAREIQFTYISSPYQRQAYIQGCSVTETQQLSDIKVKANSSLVHQFDLTFATATNSGQLLQAITERGSTGTASALPATSFAYKPQINSWASAYTAWTSALDANLETGQVRVVDVTGDGLPEVVFSSNLGGSNNQWRVFKNTGTSFNNTHETWASNLDANIDATNVRLVDVNGDALPDIVKSVNTGGSNNDWRVYANTGTSWSSSYTTWVSNVDLNLTDTKVEISDADGDGLPDIVKSVNTGGSNNDWRVYANTGTSWSSSYTTWGTNIDSNLEDTKNALTDINGDGLPDIVRSINLGGTNNSWRVWMNTGNSWPSSYVEWGTNIDSNLEDPKNVLTDINGDGLSDIVRCVNIGGSNNEYRVYRNIGTGWVSEYQLWATIDANPGDNKVVMADVNGDGLIDVVRSINLGGGNNEYRVWKNSGNASHLLSTIYTTQGGRMSFNYTASTAYDNTGVDSLSDLPFPLWLVDTMTQDNGMTNSHQTTDVTTYSYKDGYYDWQDREFRGFAEITETLPNSAKRKYIFHQDDALKGRLAYAQTTDSLSIPYAKTENVWGIATSSGVMNIKLDEEKQYIYDGATASAKVEETEYQYDTYGNIIKISELGDTSISTDNRYIYNEYIASTSAWLVNALRHTYKNSSDDSTKVSETYLYYDQHSGNSDAPHFGDVTKEVKWLSGGSNPETNYTYDSYGNVATVKDANNRTTTYTYDTTKTYPATVTNAKSQQASYSYDLGTGNVLSATDPNGLVTSYEYDVYGRISKEIKPYDNSSYPSISYQYFWDGIAPEGMLISKLETSSSSATLDTYTIIDGFGRKIQTRADAEDSTKQRIVDTFYDQSGQVAKETVPYLASTSAILTPTPPPASKFGDGSDGDITIASNTTETPIDSSVAAVSDGTTATVSAGLGFAANQIVLFHQTEGTNAGLWEFARVVSYSGTTLTLTDELTNSYSSSGSNKAQVRVIPQYNDVTVNSSITWTAKAWNGTTGGILAFLANGTVTVSGTIMATGKGFVGGIADNTGTGTTVHSGDGTVGPSVVSFSANGNGGGGGGYGGNQAAGGGGGNGTGGQDGLYEGGASSQRGIGGAVSGASDLTTMTFGGGGGNVHRYGNGGSAAGGNGGSIIFVSASTITISGGITASGVTGSANPGDTYVSSGAGAGGSVLIKAQTATLGSSLVTASGGSQGPGSVKGGAGGDGRIRVQYETSLTGSTTPIASTAQTEIPLIPAGVVADEQIPDIYVTPDPAAKYTEFDYDVLGRVSIVTSPKGDMRTTSYDHWKVTNIDEKGSIKRNFFNAFDKITRVEEVLGATTSATLYTYNARDDLTQITDDMTNVFGFTYDTLSRKTAQTDPDMGNWSYTYDPVGNLLNTTDARNITTTRTYDELNRVTAVNYPSDTDSAYTYDIGKIGVLSIATDSAGTVSYTYDNRLRKTQEARTIGATTKTTAFAYDAADRLTTQTNPDSTTAAYTFNNQGEIETMTDIVDDFDYNALGKITQKAFDNGVTTNYTYNTDDFRLNRIQTGSLFDKNYAYDAVGNIRTITDNLLSKTQTFTYDDLDRLKTATESAGFNYAYDYNSIGNLVTFTASGSATQYTYGSGSAYIKPHALTASSGTTASSGASYVFHKGVNFNGNAVTIEGNLWASMSGALSNGLSVPSGYNTANTDVTPDPAVDGDTDAMLNSAIWKSNSTLTINQTLADGNYKVYFWIMENYQSNFRQIDVEMEGEQVADNIADLSFGDWVKYGPYEVTVSDGTLNMEFGYVEGDPGVMGMAIYKDESAPPPPTEYTFYKGVNFNGNAVTIDGNSWQSMSTALSNGLSSPSGYNTASTSLTPSPSVDSDTSAMLNSVIWKQTAPLTLNQTLPNGNYQVYLWSIENWQSYFRKINVKLEGTQVATEIGNLAYGNWAKYGPYDVTVSDGTLNMEFINAQGDPGFMGMAIYQAASASAGTTYSYDNNGNMLSDGLKLYEYNEANQLKRVKSATNSATIAEYLYDFNGLRMVKKNYINGSLANTVYSWSDSFETKVIEGGATETTVYYFANKELVAKKKNDGTRQYIHTDHLGSTSIVTNSGGTLVESTSYDPWGEVLSGGTQSKFGYTGQEHDSETGLDYYNARYYNSDIRRFAQPDDIIQDWYNPQDLNRYSYVRNNPLRYTDPTGHVAQLVVAGLLYLAVNPVTGPAVTQMAMHPELLDVTVMTAIALNAGVGAVSDKQYETAVENFGLAAVGALVTKGKVKEPITISVSKNMKVTVGDHIQKDMTKRGWTATSIKEAIKNPTQTKPSTDTRAIKGGGGARNNDPATAYFGKDGKYVVVNNKTNDVVQIQNKNKSTWKTPLQILQGK